MIGRLNLGTNDFKLRRFNCTESVDLQRIRSFSTKMSRTSLFSISKIFKFYFCLDDFFIELITFGRERLEAVGGEEG